MTQHLDVIDRIRAAGDRIEVHPDLEAIHHGPTPSAPERGSRGRRVFMIAACVGLTVGAGVTVARWSGPVTADRSAASPSTVPVWIAPIPVPPDAPAPGAMLPGIVAAPDWLTPVRAALRDGGQRTGSWVSTALGIPDGEGYRDPILVSIFDGTSAALDDSVPLAGDDTIRTTRLGSWQAVFTTTSPTLVVQGEADQSMLLDVLRSSSVVTDMDEFTVSVAPRTDGYIEISAPRLLATDTPERRSLGGAATSALVNEVSDWVDPLLYAAATGADITPVRLADHSIAWSGSIHRNPGESLIRFVVWSPVPGVVFEIVSTDPDRPVTDLVTLADSVEPISATDWDAAYPEEDLAR